MAFKKFCARAALFFFSPFFSSRDGAARAAFRSSHGPPRPGRCLSGVLPGVLPFFSSFFLDDTSPDEAVAILVEPRSQTSYPSLQCDPIVLPLQSLPLVTQLVLGNFDNITSYTWSVSGQQLLDLMTLLPAVRTMSIASVDGAHVIGRIDWNVDSLQLGFGPRQPVRRIHYHGTAQVEWANYHDQSVTVVSTHVGAACHGNVEIVNN